MRNQFTSAPHKASSSLSAETTSLHGFALVEAHHILVNVAWRRSAEHFGGAGDAEIERI